MNEAIIAGLTGAGALLAGWMGGWRHRGRNGKETPTVRLDREDRELLLKISNHLDAHRESSSSMGNSIEKLIDAIHRLEIAFAGGNHADDN